MNPKKIRVACILDTFSYECFKYECQLFYLSKNSWQKQLEEHPPHFLFVESFWEGLDGSWKGGLSENFEVFKLLAYCRLKNIKTVFWNKEDPPNFDVFIKLAEEFDYIFTTDENCVGKYKRILNKNEVYLLPFAAQAKIHNPINKQYNGKVAFAGSWYKNSHFLRQFEMEYILDAAINFKLDIYDRNFKNGISGFPNKYKNFVRGCLTYDETVQNYKKYSVFLNTNIVFYSNTMFSRRVFELLASGTSVISSYALGIKNIFPHIVPLGHTKQDIANHLKYIMNDKLLLKSLSILGIREIYDEHLYKHRFGQIIKKIGLNGIVTKEISVYVLVRLTKIENITNIIYNFLNQKYKKKKLIILSDIELDKNIIKVDYLKIENYEELVNIIDMTECVSIMHESSYYGPSYLVDYVHALEYTDSPVLGKSVYYINSNASNFVENGKENAYVELSKMNYKTLVFRLDALNKKQLLNLIRNEVNDIQLTSYYCYSINMHEFSDYFVCSEEIHNEININEVQLPQIEITPLDYKNILMENTFSKSYIGFEKILINESQGKPLVIYATGVHTEKVLKLIDCNRLNIIGLADSNGSLSGTYKYNLLIETLDYWLDKGVQNIYISSKEYESDIYIKLKEILDNKVKIINLYTLYSQYAEDIFKELYLEDILL